MMLMAMVMVHERLEVRRTDGLVLIEALLKNCTELVVAVVVNIVVAPIVEHVDVGVVCMLSPCSFEDRWILRRMPG